MKSAINAGKTANEKGKGGGGGGWGECGECDECGECGTRDEGEKQKLVDF